MYGGKVGPSVLTGGAVVAGSQVPLGPYFLMGFGLLVAALVVARIVYRRRHRAVRREG